MCNENQIVLGVVTDSHVPERMKSIPASALQSFYQNDVTTILHAGDICNSRTLTQLEKVAPVIAVRGNRDIWSSSGRSLPLSLVVEFGGVKIGLCALVINKLKMLQLAGCIIDINKQIAAPAANAAAAA